MTIRIKSIVFKKDGKYKVYIKIFNAIKTTAHHLELADKALKEGYKSKHLIAVCDSTWNPFSLDVCQGISEKEYKKIYKLIYNKVKRRLEEIKLRRDKKDKIR